MKHLIWLFLVVLTSCINVDPLQEEVEYHKFSQSDYQFIPLRYKSSGIIHEYQSDTGEKITLQNFSYSQTEEVVTPTLFSSVHYDNVYIVLKWENLPDCNQININIAKGSIENLGYTINFNSMKNGFCGGIIESFNTQDTFQQMTIGSKMYRYVIKLNFSNIFINTSNGKNINAAYYDLERGLIGFENAETNTQYWLK